MIQISEERYRQLYECERIVEAVIREKVTGLLPYTVKKMLHLHEEDPLFNKIFYVNTDKNSRTVFKTNFNIKLV